MKALNCPVGKQVVRVEGFMGLGTMSSACLELVGPINMIHYLKLVYCISSLQQFVNITSWECTAEPLNAIILVQHTHKLKARAQTRHSNAICNSKAEPHTHKNFTLFHAITLT